MKKTILSIIALACCLSIAAQSLSEQQQREWRQLKHKRDISLQSRKPQYPLAPETTAKSSADYAKDLPQDRVWFPGEWEEVKAIVVTPYYSYYPDTNLGAGTYIADPLVTGVADYYKYSPSQGGWVETGKHGPYRSVMDSTSTFGKVFFYLMDGIQKGHAEAWVRVEHAKDSACVLRTLARLGLRHDSVRFIEGPGNSFWYRDCGPICFYHGSEDRVAMMDFGYYPGRALDDSLPSLITQQMNVPNYITPIEWEGGNCLVDGAGFLFTSDAIYNGNTDQYGQLTWDGVHYNSINYTNKTPLTAAQTREAFRSLIGQRETHILPAFQYDGGTGHVDLYADMCEENGFVFSIMPSAYSGWTDYRTGTQNMDSLCSYRSFLGRNYLRDSIPFPKTDNGGNFSSQADYNNNYTRTYSNHTFVNDLILQPCFSTVANGRPTQPWDRENIEALQAAYPGYTIYPIDVREFDGSGGAIHCVTKQIPADNPVRILHKSIVGCADAMDCYDIPVSAIITNRSGISHAECIYRINGGEWQTLPLNPNGNKYSAMLPTASLEPDSANAYNFEYYISATSNNGKTMCKPITAHQGGYYRFFMDGRPDIFDSTDYDFSTDSVPATDITFLFDAQRTQRDTTGGAVAIFGPADEQAIGQFYPNPASDRADIRLNLGNGASVDVDIIDQVGRLVHHALMQSAGTVVFTIRTASLAPGIYTVRFATNGQTAARRLVVR